MSGIRDVETDMFNKRMLALKAATQLTCIDLTGMVRLAVSDFEPFEGEFAPVPYLTIHMCTKHIGRIRRIGSGQHLEGVMRPGSIGIALPNSRAEGYWTRMQMLAIGIDLDKLLLQMPEQSFSIDRLSSSASTVHNDPLLTSVMTAIWRDAEAHGLSTLFFEHGLMLLLKKLSTFQPKALSSRSSRPLDGQRLQSVLELMEDRIGTNVHLLELAQLAGQDKSSFSKSFHDAMGYAPYEYFTLRRMDRAKQLLQTGSTVTDVAFNVGYTNPSKFSATFRKVFGITPSVWRRGVFLDVGAT
ncbi:MAG: helix-turn-helix transcriptional regulator [Methylophilaceae bacterium]